MERFETDPDSPAGNAADPSGNGGDSRQSLSRESGESPSEETSPGGGASRAEGPIRVVGIGASAGGLEALERLFERMPDDTGMAFVVVQHLSPDFKSLMGQVLARWSKMPIRTVEDGMPVTADTVFLMPSKTEMIISDGRLLLTARERSDELRLPIDQFFRSLARDCGPRAVAIVLSGTGSDASRGIRDIHDAGGLVLAQTPETAKFDGMPVNAIETGVVDDQLAPEEMPAAILRRVRQPGRDPSATEQADGMTPVFRLLRQTFGIDFTYYKPSTVSRRTEHRLKLTRAADLAEYVELIRDSREELDALYRDLLIGVTSFFRDAEAFTALESTVLPELLSAVKSGEEFRVWVAGCATGEEAYSIAILVLEQIAASGKQIHAKVFATDVHPRSLEFAAAGVYSEEALGAVSPQRRERFFSETKDGYRVSPELRNTVVFAQHNIIRDAPFTRMNLISCRNLLIYLVPGAQNKAVSLFHFGLKTGGVLFLGPSESPGEVSGEFESLHAHWKLYRKSRDAKLPPDLRLTATTVHATRLLSAPEAARDSGMAEVFSHALEATGPPSVLVNAELDVVHTFGDASAFLSLRRGQPSLGILDMLGGDLRMAVGAALHRSVRTKERVTLNSVRTQRDGGSELVNVSVIPLPASRRNASHTLVRFEPAATPKPRVVEGQDLDLTEAARDRIDALEAELRFTKENLQATIEELETSNEELQATNEELLASNEELQSTNEELHSVNEELYTVNAEYQKKIEELTELTHDMDNLLSSTDVHTIFLDDQLCIRRFTPKMAEVFNLIKSDIGRRIHGFVHSIRCEELPEKLTRVLNDREQHEEEVQNAEGESFLMRILPYKGDPNKGGVVVTLIDITNLKEAETRFRNAMEVSPNGMLMVCSRGIITQVNSELERIFGYEPGELLGKPLGQLIAAEHRERHAGLRQEYFRNPFVLRRMGGMPYVWGAHKSGERIPLDVHVRPISTPHGRQAIASVVDVSQHQQLEESLRDQVQRRDHFLATLSHELRNPMGALLSAASLLDQTPGATEEITKPSRVIIRQASQMARLLDDLLDVARVTQGKIGLRLEVVDLVEICRDSIEAVHPLIAARHHHLGTYFPADPIWVQGDRVRLLQVIENLLTNAVKYTDPGGRIDMRVAPENGKAVLRVRDSGRGMTREFIASIFDMFVQSDDTLDRSDGGMGVGLTLVRSLVEMHDGTIEAHSEGAGTGSEFVVSLPASPEPPAAKTDRERPADRGGVRRVVLVEDESDAREMLAMLLRSQGFQVLAEADNGIDGLDAIRALRPDVAIVDIGLPRLDGYQLARIVRDEFGQTIRLVALTGYGRDEDRDLVARAGFDRHLVKPINVQHLVDLLRESPSAGVGRDATPAPESAGG